MNEGASVGEPGGFWIRLVAFLIDYVVSTAIGFAVLLIPAIVMYVVGYSEFGAGERADTLLEVVYAIYLINFYGIGYYAIGWSRWSTTVGKRIFDLYAVRTDGSKIGFWRALSLLPRIRIAACGGLPADSLPQRQARAA